MAAAPQRSESYKAQREVEDLHLVLRARSGNRASEAEIIRRYAGFVRLRSSSYFIAGGDPDDLVQEGLVGLYKAIRDYRVDKDTTFRSFAELCITRQIITAIKTATRHKHAPLNGALSFSHTPAGYDDGSDFTLGDALPGSPIDDPARRVVATEELAALVGCLGSSLSPLEGRVLTLYLEGRSYEEIGEIVECDPKAVDNALQRVKRKVGQHLDHARRARRLIRPSSFPASPRPVIVAAPLRRDDAREVDALGQRPELNRRSECAPERRRAADRHELDRRYAHDFGSDSRIAGLPSAAWRGRCRS